ncbi:hypothetical protein D6_0087 [Aeromonas phage D6]|uniref:Internal head protein n=1 Tax=Aeromonas phage D6 TaxID=2593322 RepID=A0A514TW40_9CAUD|nr:virion structural protein [Aeromonas phage D6]QDJ97247.1 hypothetical protein D6_0087 [Aeromonas phage D6]
MDKDLETKLLMSEVSLAKIDDVEKMTKEAKAAVHNLRTDVRIKDRVEEILKEVESRQDYELTTSFIQQVDSEINEYGRSKIGRNGMISVAGTEAFGLTIMPRDWRSSRLEALRDLLADTYKNIKRWANQLEDSFKDRWTEISTTLEVIRTRVDNVEEHLDMVQGLRDECRTVTIPGIVVKALTKGSEPVPKDISSSVIKDINYFASVMKFVEAEEVRVKNAITKYFGNPKLKDMSSIVFGIPRILDVRVKSEDQSDVGKYVEMASRPFLEGFRINCKAIDPRFLKNGYEPGAGNTDLVSMMVECGIDLQRVERRESKEETIKTLTLSDLFTLTSAVKDMVLYIERANDKDSPLNMNPSEVKDNLATLKSNEDEKERADHYVALATDYQFRLNALRADIASYLTVLTSHLLTFITLNLECYDA